MAGRYAHAKQFKCHQRKLKFLRTRLSRLCRDIRRKIAGKAEVECTGKGKARSPYEFGVKVSVVATNARAPGGPTSQIQAS